MALGRTPDVFLQIAFADFVNMGQSSTSRHACGRIPGDVDQVDDDRAMAPAPASLRAQVVTVFFLKFNGVRTRPFPQPCP
jgi:hypothetical protein